VSRQDSILSVIGSTSDMDARLAAEPFLLSLDKLSHGELERFAPKIIDHLSLPVSGYKASILLRVGKVYGSKNAPDWAIRFFKLAFDHAEKLKDQSLMGLSQQNIAAVYDGQGLLTESLRYYYEGLKIFERNQDFKRMVIVLYNASLINYKAHNYYDCIRDFESGLKAFEKISADSATGEIKFHIMSGWNTVGLAQSRMKNWNQALEAYQHALNVASEINNPFWVALINGNRANSLIQMGRLQEAIGFLTKDMRISARYGESFSASVAASNLVETYVKMKMAPLAKSYLDSSRYFLKQDKKGRNVGNDLSFVRASASYFTLIHDYQNAYQLLQRQLAITDSIRNEEQITQLTQIKARYELEKKEEKIHLLTENNELQQKEIDYQKKLILGAALFATLAIIFLFYFLRSNRQLKRQNEIIAIQREDIEEKNSELEAQSLALLQQNELIRISNTGLEAKVEERTLQLAESVKELDTFLYHASHDIRRPIATLLGLEQVARISGETDPKSKHLFDYVASTARDMDSMLSKLQMAYHLNQLAGDFGWISLNWIIKEATKKFDSQFHEFGIECSVAIENPISSYSSPTLLMIVFQNIIENAINFRNTVVDRKPLLKITLRQHENEAVTTIEDNGMGIERKYLTQIFELYFRGTERSKGNGLGLYLTRKALSKLDGRVMAESIYGERTVFTISLPLKAPNT